MLRIQTGFIQHYDNNDNETYLFDVVASANMNKM